MTTVLPGPTAGPAMLGLLGVDPTTYRRSWLHDPDRLYPETNCYADLLIELLHAAGHEPLACLTCVLGLELEGDQFSFFKPEPAALRTLYDLDVHEVQLYRPLVEVAALQLAAGKAVLVEVDGFFLPDTAATSYRREHVKTTIALEALDATQQRAHYFHNAGLYDLSGEDFRGALRVGVSLGSASLVPYLESARFGGRALTGNPLRRASAGFAAEQLAGRSDTNPFLAFADRLPGDLVALADAEPAFAASYTFATVRMAGSAATLAASYARWLLDDAGEPTAQALDAVGATCKTLGFRLARRRPFDPQPLLQQAAAQWDDGLQRLGDALPR